MPFATPISALRSTFSFANTCWAEVIQHAIIPQGSGAFWSTHRIRTSTPSGGVLKLVLVRLALRALVVHFHVLLRAGSPLSTTSSVLRFHHRYFAPNTTSQAAQREATRDLLAGERGLGLGCTSKKENCKFSLFVYGSPLFSVGYWHSPLLS